MNKGYPPDNWVLGAGYTALTRTPGYQRSIAVIEALLKRRSAPEESKKQ